MKDAINTPQPSLKNGVEETIPAKWASKQSKMPFLPPRPNRKSSFRSVSEGARRSSLGPGSLGEIHDNSDTCSDASREALRSVVLQRRDSLTSKEFSFLEDLISRGKEKHLETARQTLSNENLFFDEDTLYSKKKKVENKENYVSDGILVQDFADMKLDDYNHKQLRSVNNETRLSTNNIEIFHGENGDMAFQNGEKCVGERDSKEGNNIGEVEKIQNQAIDLTRPIPLPPSNLSIGSATRLAQVAIRRSSSLHGQMWRAHQSGLALTSAASLQTLNKAQLRRSSSFRKVVSHCKGNSSVSVETLGLLGSAGPIPKDQLKLIFRANSYALKNTMGSRARLRRATVPDRPRCTSTTQRQKQFFEQYEKSLESCDLDESGRNSFSLLQKAEPIRSESISSIPSIRHAVPLRQESSGVLSTTSIPSIHPSTLIRGESNASSVVPVESISRDEFKKLSSKWLTGTEAPDSQEMRRRSVSKEIDVPTTKETDYAFNMLPHRRRPVLMRKASHGDYEGVGIEVAQLHNSNTADAILKLPSVEEARKYKSMLSSVTTSNCSFDDTFVAPISILDKSFFELDYSEIKKSLSSDGVTSYALGNAEIDNDSIEKLSYVHLRSSSSWENDSLIDEDQTSYDAWDVFKDEYAVGYGFRGLPFHILGTSADDVDSHPHVLSPPLMESLSNFLPFSIAEENFWMKYSLVRDGASLFSLLQHIRGSHHTILAIETTDGEVFGSFTSMPWRKNFSFFGTGESFLWRMRKTRKTQCHSVIDQAQLESEIDVFLWTGNNNCVQLCTSDRIVVGGGTVSKELDGEKNNVSPNDEGVDYGFGLAIESDLLNGTSSFCATFDSPPLSKEHSDGSCFEIVNLEVWSLTPALTVEEAEKLELGRLFFESHRVDKA